MFAEPSGATQGLSRHTHTTTAGKGASCLCANSVSQHRLSDVTASSSLQSNVHTCCLTSLSRECLRSNNPRSATSLAASCLCGEKNIKKNQWQQSLHLLHSHSDSNWMAGTAVSTACNYLQRPCFSKKDFLSLLVAPFPYPSSRV